MTEPFSPSDLSAGESSPSHEVWIGVLTRPSENTFREYLNRDRPAQLQRAFLWISVAAVLGTILSFLISSLIGTGPFTQFPTDQFGAFEPADLGFGGLILGLICLVPLAAILAPLFFGIYAGIVQLIARLLGGAGSFQEMAYAMAAYSAPLAVISNFLSAIPVIVCLTVPLGIYGFVLNVIAVKAVHRLDWVRSGIAALAVPVLVFLLAICVFVLAVAGLVAMGPEIGDVFSEVLRELSTPAP